MNIGLKHSETCDDEAGPKLKELRRYVARREYMETRLMVAHILDRILDGRPGPVDEMRVIYRAIADVEEPDWRTVEAGISELLRAQAEILKAGR